MALLVHQKIAQFWQDDNLQARFIHKLEKVSLDLILWPERKPGSFGRSFIVQSHGKRMPYPLIAPMDRLYFAERYLELVGLDTQAHIHPALLFYHLRLFQWQYNIKVSKESIAKLKKLRQKGKISKAKVIGVKTDRHLLYGRIIRKAGRLLARLEVSTSLRRAKDELTLTKVAFEELQNLSMRYECLESENQSLLINIELLQQRQSESQNITSRHEDLLQKNKILQATLDNRNDRIQSLEQNFQHLSDKLLDVEEPSEESLLNELHLLRHEYNLISQKYDALISKNIELSNKTEVRGPAMALEDILNSVRDRVNQVLRRALAGGDELLIVGLQREIDQLKRARVYLGRSLYDIGMLYMRAGKREQAIREWRAARELGVENHEVNLILGARANR